MLSKDAVKTQLTLRTLNVAKVVLFFCVSALVYKFMIIVNFFQILCSHRNAINEILERHSFTLLSTQTVSLGILCR